MSRSHEVAKAPVVIPTRRQRQKAMPRVTTESTGGGIFNNPLKTIGEIVEMVSALDTTNTGFAPQDETNLFCKFSRFSSINYASQNFTLISGNSPAN